MFGIGMPELVLIFVIALLVFGPNELPKLAKSLGRVMAEFKRTSDDLMHQVQRELDAVEAEETKPSESPPAGSEGVPADAAAAEPAPPLVPDPAAEGPAVAAQDAANAPPSQTTGEGQVAATETPDHVSTPPGPETEAGPASPATGDAKEPTTAARTSG